VDLHHKFVVALLLGCNKPRLRVNARVVLSADLIHRYPIEQGDEVGDRMVVALQKRFLHLELPFYLPDH